MSRTCKYCGNTLNEGDNFCQKCGAVADAVQDSKPGMAAQANQTTNNTFNNQQVNSSAYEGATNGTAIAAFVCSLIGFIIAGVILGIVSISLGAAALNHIKSFPGEKGKGLATAAIVIGIIDIIAAIIAIPIIMSAL